tara:strand:+ start:3227 stop:7333 length:4107 start_codon:yes stop_codon:yes gene_type:complete
MKQITDIENIIKLLSEEPDMVPNPPGTEDQPTTMELTDFQKLLGLIKGNLSSEVFDNDYNRWEDNVVREVDDDFIYIDMYKGKEDDRSGQTADLFGMEDWDFDIVKDMVENNYDAHYYDPFACDSADEEWNEGYGASALNEENKKLLETYFSYVSPVLGKEITKVMSVDTNGQDWGDVANKMQNNVMGNTLVDELLSDYCSTINPAMVHATAKDVRKEWDDILKKKGATDWFDADEILTFTIPLKEMIYTYYKQNRQKNGDTLEEMVSYVIEDIGSAFGNLNDWWWESDYYEDFQNDYNNEATYTINRFIKKIEELEEDDMQKLDKIREINDKLTEAGIEMSEDFRPKGAPYTLRIIELDTKDLKLRVNVRPDRKDKGWESTDYNWGTNKTIKMDIDDLLKKIYNPEITSADEKQQYMSMTYEQVQRLNENKLTETDRDVEVNKFVKFCKDELDINELPPVTLRYDKNKGENHSAIDTTAYQSKDQGVHVYVKDRALVDVLRSLAHELVHHHQLERDEDYYWKHIEDNPGIQSGTDLEDEANARAGSLIKDWGLVHGNKQIYEQFNELEDETEELEEDLENWAYDGDEIGPIKEGLDFEPFTQSEVKVMNTIANRFSYNELKEIANSGDFTPSILAKKYLSLVKLFGVNNDSKAQAMDYGRIWAKWIVDNWDNHEGTVDSPDFTPLIGKEGDGKSYLDEYEVEGEEDIWEKAFRQGRVYMYGFDNDSMEDYAHKYFYDYDPDMETVDWGDSDREDFRIGNVNKLGNELRINEQSIDISEIPDEDLSPELEVGDRVYAWDLRDDTLESDMVYPDQVIGNVVSVEEDKLASNINWSRSIYYDIETIKGENVVLYPGDKYIKLPKKQLNEEEGTSEDLEAQVFRFIRPIDIEKALSQKEIQKVLKSLGLKYDMFDTLNIDLESDMVEDLRNQIRFDNFYKRMMAASDIRGGTWEGLFAGLFNGKVVAGDSGVGKADVMTPEGGWSLKFVGNKNESPTLGSLKTQLQKVKEEGLVPEDATIYGIFSTPDNQTSSELFEAKHQILDNAFQGVDFIAVAYPIPQQNTIIMHFTDMDNLKTMIIDSENPPINKPKSGPEALGELRLSSKGWKSLAFLQITFPEVTSEKYEEYLKKYPREKEIQGVFGKHGGKIPPEVLQYLRKNPKSVINRLQNIPGYDKYFTEEFIGSSEYLTQNANDRLKSFKNFLNERCDMKEIPRTIGFQPREAWEDGLQDIFGRCWFHSTPKGIEGAFGNLADKTFELFPQAEYPEVKEKVDEIFKTSEQVYKYLFPPKEEELKYSLRNVVQADATEILYNDVKELVEEAEKVEIVISRATEQEYLEYLEGIRNRIELILNIFTSSVGSPRERKLGFRTN